jgi:hypothetical protein
MSDLCILDAHIVAVLNAPLHDLGALTPVDVPYRHLGGATFRGFGDSY